MRSMLVLPALVLVAACEMPPASSPPAAAPSATCDASGLSARFLGRTQDEVQAAVVPNSRIIQPNSPVALDYRGERANFELNAQGRVSRVYCG